MDCGRAEHHELQEGYARLEDLKEQLEAVLGLGSRSCSEVFRTLIRCRMARLCRSTTAQVSRMRLQFVFGWSKERWQTDNDDPE
jgi:hypothetical protein